MFGNEARGLDLFRSGKRDVAYGHFEVANMSILKRFTRIDICTKGQRSLVVEGNVKVVNKGRRGKKIIVKKNNCECREEVALDYTLGRW